MKKVPLPAPPYPIFNEEEIKRTYSIYSENLIDDYYLKGMTRFEEELAEYLGVKYAFATNSGYSAILLNLLAADVKAGDEVVVPAISWAQTLSPVVHIGATPVFADIDRYTFQVSFEEIKRVVTNKTKAVLVVSLYGASPELDKIKQFCEQKNIYLIEDSAHSMGCTYQNRFTSTYGHMGAISFNKEKLLGVGGAGATVTDSKDLYEKIIYYGSKSLHKRYILQDTDYNLKDMLDYTFLCHPILQELCRGKLPELQDLNGRRRENVKFLRDEISDIKHLAIQDVFHGSDLPLHMFSFLNLSPISQDMLFKMFKRCNLPIFAYNPTPLNKMKSERFSWAAEYKEQECKNAERLSENEVCIISYKWYTKDQDYLRQYSDVIHYVYEEIGKRV